MEFPTLTVLLLFGLFCYGQHSTPGIRVTTEKTFFTYEAKHGWQPIKPTMDNSIVKTMFSTTGFKLREERYQNDILSEQTTYHYESDRIKAINHYHHQKHSIVRKDITQEYAKNMFPSKINHYDSNNMLVDYSIYAYNSDQQLVKSTVYTPDDKIAAETNFEYDSKKNVVRIANYTTAKAFDYTDYNYLSYDGKGNWTQRLEIKNSTEPVLNIRTIEYY